MNSIVDGIEGLVSLTRNYAENIDGSVADRENDFRSMCFWNMHNRMIITKEIVEFYGSYWARIPGIDDGLEVEMSERIMTVTRNMFTDIVSSIEKCVKDCVNVYCDSGLCERSLEGGKNYLYLRNIINASADLGYIPVSAYREWDTILLMRNLVTHNNSMSDRRGTFDICGIHIVMRPNRMMKGPQDTFIILSRRILELYYDWLMAIHGRFS